MNKDGPAGPERARQGAPWLPDEDRQLYNAFVAGHTAAEAAVAHQRSDGAIRSRLRRLGLVDENGLTIEPTPPFSPPVSARAQATPAKKAGNKDPALKQVFAVTTAEGWRVEIKSNLPLTRELIDRLAAMLVVML
jgi:Fe2+ transport system protein FeoA